MRVRILGVLFLTLMAGRLSFAATLNFKSGEKKQGRIVASSSEEMYVSTPEGVSNYPLKDIKEVTQLSGEELKTEGVREALRSLYSPVSFNESNFKRFSKDLKADEREVLELAGQSMKKKPASSKVPTGDDLMGMFVPYQSELHEKIMKLMVRYLDRWIAEAKEGGPDNLSPAEASWIKQMAGKSRADLLKLLLPSMQSLRETAVRHLRNLAELNYAIKQAVQANQ